jgi:DNA-binding NarL/FixJ family response regulator
VSAGAPALTCVVADDHPAVVQAVSGLLAANGVEVVASAGDGEEALARIVERRPAVALVDVRMPRLDGIEVVRRARREAPETPVLLYSGYGDRALLTEALDAGAGGFVLKEAPLEEVLRAVRAVASGTTYVDPVLAGALATSPAPELTPREREVMRLLAGGLSNDEIGARLHVSPETVRGYIRTAMAKLGADTRTEAVARALRQGLIA